MSSLVTILIILILAFLGFAAAYRRARHMEDQGKKMHSRPHYYGWWTALMTLLPALIFMTLWDSVSDLYLEHRSQKQMETSVATDRLNPRLGMATIRTLSKVIDLYPADQKDDQGVEISVASNPSYAAIRAQLSKQGKILPLNGQDFMVTIAKAWAESAKILSFIGRIGGLSIAAIGFSVAFSQISARQRARNKVEQLLLWGLICASTVAILTTIGIILSMLFQTVSFFQSVSLSNFFFGTVWDPRFAGAGAAEMGGQFGLLPLLAGTLYIALVAMIFAVPVGLFSAIYMAEYALPRVRAVIKPLLEVLAGIPTIVYGYFALTIVGPFLRDLSAAIAGGHGFVMAQSVLTAGLVMGVMLIPFVSSLSDDIITAVPRSLRDGSYGLGATRSETMKRVILPAALPGIVGALLLTASRAIGETMIVVLAAGVAANLTLSPFEAMTTMTVKIVNQLTGDLEFNSPQTLVAFALGMSLFVLTLFMNIFALYIVRKYQEQYE
ncbi:phosphate ABC transporter permease subunit PstC [Bartonella sp. DGB2]|uniref:phosphate ABC transporter permease subunit PstC n=1 Tax=Bartonella sp. DGB2 TaxID=3388426 RepID=UPI00398FD4A8